VPTRIKEVDGMQGRALLFDVTFMGEGGEKAGLCGRVGGRLLRAAP